MKSIFKTATVASVAALGLSLAACDSAQENAMEEEALAVDEAAETQADAMEEAGMDEAAEAVEEAGEEKKDAMEEAADDMDADPQ